MTQYLLQRLLLSLRLVIVPVLFIFLHSAEEVDRDVGHVLRPEVGIVSRSHVRVRMLEYDLTQMLRVPLNEFVVIHQVDDVVGGEAARPLHFGHLLLNLILFLPRLFHFPFQFDPFQNFFFDFLLGILLLE